MQKQQKVPFAPVKCDTHKVVAEGYLVWHAWAHEQNKKGIKQSQCLVCGRWLFPEEM